MKTNFVRKAMQANIAVTAETVVVSEERTETTDEEQVRIPLTLTTFLNLVTLETLRTKKNFRAGARGAGPADIGIR
jgi:hypothetical protein